MAMLNGKDASSLADVMKKHNVELGAPMDSDDGDMEPKSDDNSELSSCASDLAEAISSGDKSGIVSAIMALVECIQSEDKEQDEQS
jgi:hypothetical protein